MYNRVREASAINKNVGIIINSSRSIIYSSNDESFSEAAEKEAIVLKNQMEEILIKSKLIWLITCLNTKY